MGTRIRAIEKAFGFILASVVTLAALPLAAQEPTGVKPPPPPGKKAVDSSRRVPSHFGQVGLTPEQKEEIYKIRAKRNAEVESLQKQIVQIQGAMLAECESILTDSQKQLLALRRDASARAKKAKAGTTESTVSSKTDQPGN